MDTNNRGQTAAPTGGVAQGATWLIGGRIASRGLDLAALSILAHLLSPSDFGLAALALSIVVIVETVVELPLGQSLLQIEQISKAHLDTSFTISLLRGTALSLTLAAAAYPFSNLVDDHRIFYLVIILSIAALSRGMTSPAMVHYTRAMNFRYEFWVDTVSKFLGTSLSVITAYVTRDYWALIVGSLATPVAACIITFVVAPYRPRMGLSEWKTFAHFVRWNIVSQCCSAVAWQSDRIILSGRVPIVEIGQYSAAASLSAVPQQTFGFPLQRIAWSYIAKSENHQQVADRYLISVAGSAALLLPMYVGTALVSHDVALLLLGAQWDQAGTILSISCLSAISAVVSHPVSALAYCRNWPSLPALLRVLEMLMSIGFLFAGVLAAGVMGAAIARVIVAVCLEAATIFVVATWLDVSVRAQTKAVARPLVATCIMAGAVYLFGVGDPSVTKLHAFVSLLVKSILGASIYVTSLAALWYLSGRPQSVEQYVINTTRQWLLRHPS